MVTVGYQYYVFPSLLFKSDPVEQRKAKVLDGVVKDRPDGPWNRIDTRRRPLTLVKNGATWTRTTTLPTDYDRLVGGGYVSLVTGAELDEIVAAGFITTDERDLALASPA